jgi:hypothetical protein
MTDSKPSIPPQGSPTNPKLFKRRRCQNCNALYMPTREDQKFCRTLPDRDKCRKEFYRYGSSYGPLKTGLHKAIEKKCAELEKHYAKVYREMRGTLANLRAAVADMRTDLLGLQLLYAPDEKVVVERTEVEAQVKELRGQIETMRLEFERHTHDLNFQDEPTLVPTAVLEREWKEVEKRVERDRVERAQAKTKTRAR